MKKIILLTLSICIVITGLCSCHIHKAAGTPSCTSDTLCVICGEVMKEAAGHTPIAPATCTEPSVCSVCGEVIEESKGHKEPESYSCTDGMHCTVCGAELIAPCEHIPSEGEVVCGHDKICTVCGTILEKAPEHQISGEATCTQASVCTICHEVIEPAKGHTPGPAATDTEPQVCTVCGAVLKPAKGSVSNDYIEESENEGHYKNNINAYYSGNILVCGNYAMEYFGAKAEGNKGYAEIVSAFAKKFPEVNVNCMIVPKCASFHAPSGYTDQFENHKKFIEATYSMMENVNTPDAFGEMANHKGEYLFYRTDHHWTSLGAYYASVAFCKANGIEPKALGSYETVINTDFMGTLYTYCSEPKPTTLKKDYTVGHIPSTGYTMTYTTDGKTYNGSAINKNAKSYASMFICGDQAFTDIVTDNKNGKKLIMFKESYGNGFAPYMIDYFEEIIIIDIRKSTESIAKIISDYGITDALIINNMQAVSSLQSALKGKLES